MPGAPATSPRQVLVDHGRRVFRALGGVDRRRDAVSDAPAAAMRQAPQRLRAVFSHITHVRSTNDVPDSTSERDAVLYGFRVHLVDIAIHTSVISDLMELIFQSLDSIRTRRYSSTGINLGGG